MRNFVYISSLVVFTSLVFSCQKEVITPNSVTDSVSNPGVEKYLRVKPTYTNAFGSFQDDFEDDGNAIIDPNGRDDVGGKKK